MRKSGRHFWANWGNFGPFWVIFGPLWIILGHSRAIWGHLGSYLGHFGPSRSFLCHFVAFLKKFAESSNFFAARFGSPGPLLECMVFGSVVLSLCSVVCNSKWSLTTAVVKICQDNQKSQKLNLPFCRFQRNAPKSSSSAEPKFVQL